MVNPANASNPKLINALCRLERAGSEQSKATEKLRAATLAVGSHLVRAIGASVRLANGYSTSVREGRLVLVNGSGVTLSESIGNGYPTRETCLEFAYDVAHGLLDQIADQLEAEADHATEMTEAVEAEAATHKLYD